MTLLPEVRDELVRAAERRAALPAARRRRRMRAPRGGLLTAAIVVGVAASASAIGIATGVIGGPPTNDFPRVAGETQSGFVRESAPRVLGVIRLPQTGGSIELVGYRSRLRGHPQICLDFGLPDGTNAGACAPSIPDRPHAFLGSMGLASGRLVTGATRQPVRRVALAFTRHGHRRTVAAQLVRVPRAQAAALGAPAFTLFAAPLPRGAIDARATGRDGSGRVRWRVALGP